MRLSGARGQSVKAGRFREAAEERWKDAQSLHKARRYDGAVYMCGYVLECFLKFVICERSGQPSILLKDAKDLGHNLAELLDRSGLATDLRDRNRNPDLFLAFQRVNAEWSVEIRYDPRGKTEEVSRQFLRDTKDLRSWLQAQLR